MYKLLHSLGPSKQCKIIQYTKETPLKTIKAISTWQHRRGVGSKLPWETEILPSSSFTKHYLLALILTHTCIECRAHFVLMEKCIRMYRKWQLIFSYASESVVHNLYLTCQSIKSWHCKGHKKIAGFTQTQFPKGVGETTKTIVVETMDFMADCF